MLTDDSIPFVNLYIILIRFVDISFNGVPLRPPVSDLSALFKVSGRKTVVLLITRPLMPHCKAIRISDSFIKCCVNFRQERFKCNLSIAGLLNFIDRFSESDLFNLKTKRHAVYIGILLVVHLQMCFWCYMEFWNVYKSFNITLHSCLR